VDDLLDVTQSSEHLGKAAGKDIDAGKLTYPGVLGVKASRTEVVRLRDQAHDALKAFGSEAIASQRNPDVPALKGWRRELFGEDALRLKRGELALTVRNGEVVAVPAAQV
jgi:hypothetical protein